MEEPTSSNGGQDKISLEEFQALITGLVTEAHDVTGGLSLLEVQNITGLEYSEIENRIAQIRLKETPKVVMPTVSYDPFPIAPPIPIPEPEQKQSTTQADEDQSSEFDYTKSIDPAVQPEQPYPEITQSEIDQADKSLQAILVFCAVFIFGILMILAFNGR